MLKSLFPLPSKAARKRLAIMLCVLFVLVLVLLRASRWTQGSPQVAPRIQPPEEGSASRSRPVGLSSPVFERAGQVYLWGGGGEDQHFDITEFRLRPEGLRYGLGREAFPALIDPEFESAEEASRWLPDSSRVIGVSINGDVRVYPVELLIRYEVVNDVVGGRPVFVGYCILADFAAVYDRTMAGHVFTFGVSGYTYGTEGIWHGRQGFVLWDRDTESLWWPLIDRGVSGPAVDQPMKLLDRALWEDTSWERFRAKHPNVRVLRRGQDFQRPKDWPKYTGRFEEAADAPSATP